LVWSGSDCRHCAGANAQQEVGWSIKRAPSRRVLGVQTRQKEKKGNDDDNKKPACDVNIGVRLKWLEFGEAFKASTGGDLCQRR
jgi:hypothetical protein